MNKEEDSLRSKIDRFLDENPLVFALIVTLAILLFFLSLEGNF